MGGAGGYTRVQASTRDDHMPREASAWPWGSEADDDPFAQYRDLVAPRFRTKGRRWGLLFLVFALCSIASGPLNAWVTLEPLLVDLNVFHSNATSNFTSPKLAEVQTYAWSSALLLSIPIGLVYDSLGPAKTSALGAFLAAAGIAGMAFAIRQVRHNWVLFFAYPAAMVGGSMNSYAIIGWQWLLPAHQNIINALYSASLAISDSFVMVGVAVVRSGLCTLSSFFLIVCGTSCLSGVVCAALAPGAAENMLHNAILTQKAKGPRRKTSAEDIRQQVKENTAARADCAGTHRTAWRAVRNAAKVMAHFAAPCALFQGYLCMVYYSVFYPMSTMYEYFVMLFGDGKATDLVNAYAIIYGIAGSVLTLVQYRYIITALAGCWRVHLKPNPKRVEPTTAVVVDKARHELVVG